LVTGEEEFTAELAEGPQSALRKKSRNADRRCAAPERRLVLA
jgi:hypothetical protein